VNAIGRGNAEAGVADGNRNAVLFDGDFEADPSAVPIVFDRIAPEILERLFEQDDVRPHQGLGEGDGAFDFEMWCQRGAVLDYVREDRSGIDRFEMKLEAARVGQGKQEQFLHNRSETVNFLEEAGAGLLLRRTGGSRGEAVFQLGLKQGERRF
jgi:hypothetical protein